jgi:hypothetical protein
VSGTDADTWDIGFDESSRIDDGGASVEHFKWGWNAETGEATVWRVTGGPDGPPIHEAHLTEAWGRPPSWSAGDLLGVATGADDPESGDLTITCYYGGRVPDSVVHWFSTAFPSSAVRSVEQPVPDA